MESVVYGNYVPKTNDRLVINLSDQTMNLFPVKNPKSGKKYPLVIEIHGGGFYAKRKSDRVPRELNGIDCVFASFEYRRVTRYYKDKTSGKNEKAIIVNNDNTLSESENMELYNPKYTEDFTNRTNYALKCIYDCVLQMDYLVDKSEKYQIDLQNVYFYGASAGTLMCNYLTYVYSPLKNYNVVCTSYDNAQLNYSVESTSAQVFSLYEDEFGGIDTVSNSQNIFGTNWKTVCKSFLNPTCDDKNNEVKELCVSEHEKYIKDNYCGTNKEQKFTLSDLASDERLNSTMPFANLKKIITESSVIPTYCYISNQMIGNIPHNKLYAKKYKELFAEKGVKNTFIRSGTEILSNTMNIDPPPKNNIEFVAHVLNAPKPKRTTYIIIFIIAVSIILLSLVWHMYL
jgi:hypothetical protein